MGKRSVASNAALNVIRTALAVLAPLITYPYISRVLGATNLGKVNYVNSIIQYFILFSALGISTYGIREGAKVREDKVKVSNFISECFTINMIMAIVSSIVLLLCVLSFDGFRSYKWLFLIQGALIFFDLFGIEWVNTVFEDYLYITLRTIAVYIVSIACTFLLIHTKDDMYIYAMLTVGTTGLVSVLNWIHCKKNCSISLRVSAKTKYHIKPIVVFFANKLAVSIYVSSDTTMLGIMTSDFRVGIYSVAVKIYTIVKNMIAAIYSVCIPRLAAKVGINDEDGYKELFSNIISALSLLIFPASIGLCMLSNNVIVLLFGAEYAEAGVSLSILSIGIIFAIYGGLISSVFNVTRNKEKISLQATIIAAFVNVGLNIVLIPRYQEMGAAFTTVIAELTTFLFCVWKSKDVFNYIDMKKVRKSIIEAVIECVIIVGVVIILKRMIFSNVIIIGVSIIISLLLYIVLLVIMREQIVLSAIRLLANKISKGAR